MRLYIPLSFKEKKPLELTAEQVHYVSHVMRQKSGAIIHIFNGLDGEWTGELHSSKKRYWTVTPLSQTRPQSPSSSSIWLVVAPIKRQDVLIEKVTELGVGDITPVLTDHTVIRRVNRERWKAWSIEAAEQSERLSIPLIHSPCTLNQMLTRWSSDRPLLWCCERYEGATDKMSPLPDLPPERLQRAGILVGPEGGFSEDEKRMIASCSFAYPLSLGSAILRSETAAIVAVARLTLMVSR